MRATSCARARQRRRQAEGRPARRSTRACSPRTAACSTTSSSTCCGDDAFRIVVNAGTADKDIAWLRALLARQSRAATLVAARRPRDDRGAGPERAREDVAGAARDRAGRRPALKPFNGADVPTRRCPLFVARTGYTGEDGFEIDAAGRLRGRRLAGARRRRRAAVRPRRARHAAPRGGHEPLRPGHGRDASRRSSPASRGPSTSRAERDFVGRDALLAHAADAPARRPACCSTAGGVLRAHQHVDAGHGHGETTSGTFSPTLGALDRARARAGERASRRRRARRRPRQRARRARRQAAVRAQRQEPRRLMPTPHPNGDRA